MMIKVKKPLDEYWLNCVGPGWHDIVKPLMEKANECGARIVQVKEKFGGLRFYVDGGDVELSSMIEQAEEASLRTCEECGAPGSTKGSTGWIRTLCPSCRGKV